ncbi:C4-dicarboxylate TRAP transporter large permease protein DctM [subsurface metagenome]
MSGGILADLSPVVITVLFFVLWLTGFFTGYPIALVLGFVGILMGTLVLGFYPTMNVMYTTGYRQMLHYTLLCLPMFIYMGSMLAKSGVADSLYDALYLVMGRLRGSLAIGTVILGTVLAACIGVVAASVAMLTILGLEPMVRRGYSKSLASGTVAASGTLGILIPPSILLIVYGSLLQVSVGKLFMGAVFPGLLLAGLYVTYIVVRGLLQPQIAGRASVEELDIPWSRKLLMLSSSLVPPVVLIFAVLGVIFLGIAPPTEAAAIGALAATLLAITKRRFSLRLLKEVTLDSAKVTGFAWLFFFVGLGATSIFQRLGCAEVVSDIVLAAGGKWVSFFVIMLMLFILGMVMDFFGILFIFAPIFITFCASTGFDPVWFAIMVCVNFQMAFMTPPMALSIFIVKGTAKPELGVTTADIIRGVYPFVILVMIGLLLCCFFPEIITWLPNNMIRSM